jgi:catechol 2,3-dioxygenase-like lactoylglutathione lyase family enzyme
MKRFHISIAVDDYDASVADYTKRLGCAPDKQIKGRYARWRTELLNFTISCKLDQAGGVIRHIGFEDDDAPGFSEHTDANRITWEYFSKEAQDEEIETRFNV